MPSCTTPDRKTRAVKPYAPRKASKTNDVFLCDYCCELHIDGWKCKATHKDCATCTFRHKKDKPCPWC